MDTATAEVKRADLGHGVYIEPASEERAGMFRLGFWANTDLGLWLDGKMMCKLIALCGRHQRVPLL